MRHRSLSLVLAAVVMAATAPAAVAEPDAAEQVQPDQRYGMVATDPENVAVSEPTVVTEASALPAPQQGAEVYPRPADGTYDVTGGGFGHRIGMSQYGAHGAGLAGLAHTAILSFYYPGTKLENTTQTSIRVGITVDSDGTTRVAQRSGLAVANKPGDTAYPLPGDRTEWRVRSTSTSPAGCVLEGKLGTTWTAHWPAGMAKSCPVTFSSPTESSVDVILPGEEKRVYRGKVTATHRGTTSLLTVNHLPLQQYLYSVVSAEMPSSFHQQALRTQAVAARTYAVGGSSGNAHYDTCDTTYCQVYRGRGVRTSGGGISAYEYSPNTSAVDATDKQVLTYVFANGVKDYATTMYSSSNGGWMDNGGSAHGYLVAKKDPYDATPANSRNRWHAELPVTSLESRYGIHRVERVQVLSRDGDGEWGGRILTARVEGYTAAGNYTYAEASGTGLMLARYWPTWSKGLSSDYFTFTGAAAPTPAPGSVERVAGANRYETAALLAQEWPTNVGVVYVVSGENFPDALTASARAGVYDAPVLLTKPGSVPPATAAAMKRLSPGRVVVVGGTPSVSSAVAEQLRSMTDSGSLQRVAGKDRYETAASMASFYPSGVDRVLLASGETYADALAGAARAGHDQAPLLLTRQGWLDSATLKELERLDPREIVVLGGPQTVSDTVAAQAGKHSATGTFRRLAGTDRYGTAAKVAELYPSDRERAFVATGRDFPDALVAAALAGRRGEPLLLVRNDGLPGQTATVLEHIRPLQITAMGGGTVIQDSVLKELEAFLR